MNLYFLTGNVPVIHVIDPVSLPFLDNLVFVQIPGLEPIRKCTSANQKFKCNIFFLLFRKVNI